MQEAEAVSIYNGDMEKIPFDAQHESERSSSKSSHCDSPPGSQTPQDTNRASETDTHSIGEKNSSQSEDYIKRRKEVKSILRKNSDWDWPNQPENIPAKEFLFKHPKLTATLSGKNMSVMKKGGIFSAELLKVFLPSLLLSHLLAIGLGIYIGRHLTTSTSIFFFFVGTYSYSEKELRSNGENDVKDGSTEGPRGCSGPAQWHKMTGVVAGDVVGMRGGGLQMATAVAQNRRFPPFQPSS
ncbi:BCL2/adenovirus E1B 19 kDa protein-interacting protein 3-like [Erethizon dorsatum]